MSLIPFILELADELHEINRCLNSGTTVAGGTASSDFGSVDTDELLAHGDEGGVGEMRPQSQERQQQKQHVATTEVETATTPIKPSQPQQQQETATSSSSLPQPHPLLFRRARTNISQLLWLANTKQRHHPYYRNKMCCSKFAAAAAAIAAGSPLNNPQPPIDLLNSTAYISSHCQPPTATSSTCHKNGFQVSMNVKQFAPSELSVKTVEQCVVVEGRHEDKEDGHGVISRHFIRKYLLPKGYEPSEVVSTLSTDGILTVRAPLSKHTDVGGERVVVIQQAADAEKGRVELDVQMRNGELEKKTTTVTADDNATNGNAVDGNETNAIVKAEKLHVDAEKPATASVQNGLANVDEKMTVDDCDEVAPQSEPPPPPVIQIVNNGVVLPRPEDDAKLSDVSAAEPQNVANESADADPKSHKANAVAIEQQPAVVDETAATKAEKEEIRMGPTNATMPTPAESNGADVAGAVAEQRTCNTPTKLPMCTPSPTGIGELTAAAPTASAESAPMVTNAN